jgi:hypothetical protein
MTPTSRQLGGPFMLTLCGLPGPVSIRAPHAPHLKPFTFFTSRTRQPGGSTRFHLHMGYFASLDEAQQWVQRLRHAYPQAAATRVPAALAAKVSRAEDISLTDTQVLKILETRRTQPRKDGTNERTSAEISLLRPEDTTLRRALKEAVVRGAPTSFAAQLCWSVEPVDLTTVPSVSIFRAYTLYATEGVRDGRSWYSLRLGFFSDAISAKQVAYYLRSHFPSVAVVPISEEERAAAPQKRIDPSGLADPLSQRIDEALDSSPVSASSPPEPRVTMPAPDSKARDESLERTLEMLAASELWSDDSMSETGVRHLQVDVRKRTASGS